MSEPKVTIERFLYSDEGTFGFLQLDDLRMYSGELPWRDNKSDISCIPVGEYECGYNYSNTFQRNMYLIKDVPNRNGVRIHSANYVGDPSKGYMCELKGCIALGMGLGYFRTQKCLTGSKQALEILEKRLNYKPFTLIIK